MRLRLLVYIAVIAVAFSFITYADQGLASPRLLALAESETSTFWETMRSDGVPLIEPIPGESNHSLITFLWQGDRDTKNVILYGGMASGNPYTDALHRLGTTDIWYKTFRVRNDLLVSYAFGVNHERLLATATGAPLEPKKRTRRNRDPLNDNVISGNSLVQLPNAPSEYWDVERDEVAKSTLTYFRDFESQTLGNNRTIAVYTPRDYEAEGDPYGVLVVFDLEMFTSQIPGTRIFDNLYHEYEIAKKVVVFVGNARGQRYSELNYNTSLVEFVVDEFMPWVHENFNVASDPNLNGVAGLSLGGLASAFIAFHHPDVFGNVLSQAGSVWSAPGLAWEYSNPEIEPEYITKLYATKELKPIRFSIEMGLHDGGTIRSLYATRDFRDALKSQGHDIVRYAEISAGHETLLWRRTFADGLIALFGP